MSIRHVGDVFGAKDGQETYIERTRAAVVRSLVRCTSLTASFLREEPIRERQLQTEPQFPKPKDGGKSTTRHQHLRAWPSVSSSVFIPISSINSILSASWASVSEYVSAARYSEVEEVALGSGIVAMMAGVSAAVGLDSQDENRCKHRRGGGRKEGSTVTSEAPDVEDQNGTNSQVATTHDNAPY